MTSIIENNNIFWGCAQLAKPSYFINCDISDALKNLGITMRNKADLYHDRWYTEAVALADKVSIELCLKKHRENPPASTPDYFRVAITIPLRDQLIFDLKARFDFSTINIYYGLSTVPSKITSMLTASGS